MPGPTVWRHHHLIVLPVAIRHRAGGGCPEGAAAASRDVLLLTVELVIDVPGRILVATRTV